MGVFNSRQGVGIEEVDIGLNHAYKYPPKAGSYFSNHFIMGGERFDTAQPEMYLFGENCDLNFLGTRPMPFPYPAPSAAEPSRTLKSLINVRKESLRFVRVPDNSAPMKEGGDHQSTRFNVEFTFDSDVRCSITIMYFCSEEISSGGMIYTPRDPSMNSQIFFYKEGANQQFSQVCHIFDPSKHPEEDLSYSFDRDLLPVVIYCKTEESVDIQQVHATIAVVERYSDGYSLKPLKQKLYVDGLCYLLQEIYGIENKNADNAKSILDDDTEDNGAECVICMCDLRDTLILPCRHLCLCYSCADSLRYQANNCPICRAPFRALLQIKALQQCNGTEGANEGMENDLAGYEAVSLIEALNGPSDSGQRQSQASDAKNKSEAEGKGKTSGVEDSTTQTDCLSSSCENSGIKSSCKMKMSSLLAQESQDALFQKYGMATTESCDYILKKRQFMKAAEESQDALFQKYGKATDDSCSYILKKPQFMSEDSVMAVTESNRMEGNDLGGINRKLRKSISVSSPVCTDSDVTTKKDNKLYRSESAGVDDSGETLSLLQGENAESHIKESRLENNASKLESPLDDSDTIHINVSDSSHGDEKKHSPQPMRRNSTNASNRSKIGRRKRQHSMRSDDYENADDISGTDSNTVHGEPSLPGTPLSTTSTVSRISDISASSASSTRALIISHSNSASNSIV